ncbi:UDP-N-acetylglucosamine--N-acetylmuramyl-(pentapeptide) pyrophosphoryl-undecaprenol N-acetylglucosamine transferase [BD1-7 clade bacterium]|uniref:UDP-N-acetylglucosamine--N-acetylmuramyl-(pentapeptide) pyrophosphoryl-undecaprenol N-acetylglucosamine transferase n=1 Tax=BD1-7 clade bacterium TaxID=2029982 RepID=A0A5S9N1Y9_9GAMM|nr:UDP-N-acetylglucosamine--N-acetylmuramyl-(pentapeptide) pyrophosphoryl-undecaprenol N-acetylglucosamine transferase [BD1-7 clade bacterium]
MTQEHGKKQVLIMAGGTGGHVFPGLAVASELLGDGHSVTWLGTRKGIESRLVPEQGIDIQYIDITGVRGKGAAGLLLAPFRILKALLQSRRLIRQIKPDAVLGMGGFAAGPGGLAARLMGIPLVIHEQNAVAGTTNRILARFAKRILQAFPDAFPAGEMVGNPVRQSICDQHAQDISTAQSPSQQGASVLRVLVVGGSLGAKAINDVMPDVAKVMGQRIQVRHQTGKGHVDVVADAYRQAGLDVSTDLSANTGVWVNAFIDDMADAYQWANLVICRSGAMTVSEIAAAGKTAVFVPFPFAIDDHQTANARWLSDNDAAVLMPQPEMNVDSLQEVIELMVNDPQVIDTMQQKAREMAIVDAATRVAGVCLEEAL